MNKFEEAKRYYTLTLKPSLRAFMGDRKALNDAYIDLLLIVGGETEKIKIEKMGTQGEHIHALIRCPFINNKSTVSKMLIGFHTHMEVIRKNREDEIPQIWALYINKEQSDSTKYHSAYGDMFPLDELY